MTQNPLAVKFGSVGVAHASPLMDCGKTRTRPWNNANEHDMKKTSSSDSGLSRVIADLLT